MPRKNTKKQPYVLFCLERQQTDPELASKSLPELVDLCSGMWGELSPEQRGAYVRSARDYNCRGYSSCGSFSEASEVTEATEATFAGKFNSSGVSLLANYKKEKRSEFYHETMKDDIRARVIKSQETSSIPMMRVHVLSVNNWIEGSKEVSVFPAEIGLVTFSIRDGILSRFNQMVDPGELPLGYKAEAKGHSEKYHQIWLDNNELSGNYYTIVDRIRAVVTVRNEDGESFAGSDISIKKKLLKSNTEVLRHVKSAEENALLPIYVMPMEKYETIRAMRWLCRKAEVDYEFTFYDLPVLFWEMMAHAYKKLPETMTLNIVEETLKMDVFLYVSGVSCNYHESISSCCCAGGKSSRLAFIICDYGCQMYGIKPIEGRHVPNGISVDDVQESMSGLSLSCSGLSIEAAPERTAGKSFSRNHILSGILTHDEKGNYTCKSVEDIVGEPVPIPRSIRHLVDIPIDPSLQDTTFFSIEEEDSTTIVNPDDYLREDSAFATFHSVAE